MSASKSVREICEMEQNLLDRRSLAEKLGDLIAVQAGRMWFIIAHALWFGVWIGLNHGLDGFDPFPFSLLTTIVSLEAIFLSLFILMSENRAGRQNDHRSHLDLQINLLAERENTAMLRMLRLLCEKNGLAIANDPEIVELACATSPKDLDNELRENLPDAEK